MQPGDQVPPLQVRLQDGRLVPLASLHEDGPLVLFFYPKAFTPGCTAESCHFRDLAGEFAEVGASIAGVSRDDAATQARFADEHDLGYPLVADEDGDVSRAFGTKRLGPLMSRRHTFVIDHDGTVLAAIRSETDMDRHADEALETLRRATT